MKQLPLIEEGITYYNKFMERKKTENNTALVSHLKPGFFRMSVFLVLWLISATFSDGRASSEHNGERMAAIQFDPDAAHYCLREGARFLNVYDQYLSPEQALSYKKRFIKRNELTISHEEKEIWVHFILFNPTDIAEKFYLNGQYSDYVELYRIDDEKPVLVCKSGYLINFSERPILDWGLIVTDDLAANATQQYLLRLKSVTRNARFLMDYALGGCVKLYSNDGYLSTYKLRRRLTYFFLGAMFIIFIYNFSIALFTRNREYLLFSLYIILTVLTILFITDAHLETGILMIWDGFRNFSYICFAAIPITYIWFSAVYLDLKERYPQIYKKLVWATWSFSIIIGLIVGSVYTLALYLLIALSCMLYLSIIIISIKLSATVSSARLLLICNALAVSIALLQVFNLMDWITTSQMIVSAMTMHLVEIAVFSFSTAFKLRTSKVTIQEMQIENKLYLQKVNSVESQRKKLEFDNDKKSRALMASSVKLFNLNQRITEVLNALDQTAVSNQPAIKELQKIKQFENEWEIIKMHFENVHPDFFRDLELHFPVLSRNDHKVLAFMKMKLSNKEIALTLNITTRAVEQTKRRIKKKIGMKSHETNILNFIEKKSDNQPAPQ